jgi:tRNA(Ile)-lysidine synthase TilS/MesJ
MKLMKLKEKEIPEIATSLKNYWKERNMNYSQKWVENYIKQDHKKEIKKRFILHNKRKRSLRIRENKE